MLVCIFSQIRIGAGHLVFVANGPAFYLVLDESVLACAELFALGDGVIDERNVLALLPIYLDLDIRRWSVVEYRQ